jgi:hypothetical protein
MTNVGSFLNAIFAMAGLEGTQPPTAARDGARLASMGESAAASFPEGWERLRIERVYIGGEAFTLDAMHGQPAKLTPRVRRRGPGRARAEERAGGGPGGSEH